MLRCKNKEKEVSHSKSYMLYFGESDLAIEFTDAHHWAKGNHSKLGLIYEMPRGFNEMNSGSFLAGS